MFTGSVPLNGPSRADENAGALLTALLNASARCQRSTPASVVAGDEQEKAGEQDPLDGNRSPRGAARLVRADRGVPGGFELLAPHAGVDAPPAESFLTRHRGLQAAGARRRTRLGASRVASEHHSEITSVGLSSGLSAAKDSRNPAMQPAVSALGQAPLRWDRR